MVAVGWSLLAFAFLVWFGGGMAGGYGTEHYVGLPVLVVVGLAFVLIGNRRR